MAAYGYWMFAKGWRGPAWLPMMRLDNAVGYVMTGIFVVAMLVVGSTLLFGQDLTSSDSGLLTLGTVLGEQYGRWARVLFLVGFLSVTSSSLLGVWNGVSLMFTDWIRVVRLTHGRAAEAVAPRAREFAEGAAERSRTFRGYLLWLTVPPMMLLFIDRPFALTLVYGVLGAVFMPFLAITLMLLLNSSRVAAEGRSGWLSNTVLTGASALFLTLLVTDVVGRF